MAESDIPCQISPSKTKLWHPSTDRSAFVRIWQHRAKDSGRVPSTQVLGNGHKDLGPDSGTRSDCELILDPLSYGCGTPGEHWLRQSPKDKRAIIEVRSPAEKFQCMDGATKYKIGCIGEGRRNSLTLPASLPSQGGTDACQESRCPPMISPVGKSESL
ncbi:hypothetical protein mRhiFer1_008423 [Rhinolophus ferrumequinum]|uniref:Uncharacterized protein n=1 Tax=Rhinolophus ferrumequinum TaxID=59479 RepID=A0A7J7V829_RHIFE|nr:hypothetical protein mRhiFer1_008423 [Rhinolophus ferrumequinum]